MEVEKAGVWSVHRRFMDDISEADSKRPNFGFPLGIIVVVVIVLGISALFSFCYHWEKLKTLYTWHTNPNFGDLSSIETVHPDLSQAKSASACKNVAGIQQGSGMLAVVMMPGEKTPNFIACPCPMDFSPHCNPRG